MVQSPCVVADHAPRRRSINHLGIRADHAPHRLQRLLDPARRRLLLVGGAARFAPSLDFARLVTFTNYSGAPRRRRVAARRTAWRCCSRWASCCPRTRSPGSTPRPTPPRRPSAPRADVPRGIVRSVLVSGLAGWVMLSAVVLAMPDLDEAARQGRGGVPLDRCGAVAAAAGWRSRCLAGIAVAQYLCGLATVTSASRMAFAFARDGGLPSSRRPLGHARRNIARRPSRSGPSRRPPSCSPSTRRSTRRSPPSARSSSTSPTSCRRRSAACAYGRTGRRWARGASAAGTARWPASACSAARA